VIGASVRGAAISADGTHLAFGGDNNQVQTFTVESPAPITTVPATMPTATVTETKNGAISISTSPAGANIYLDNRYMGITPLTVQDLTPGTYAVLLQLQGFEAWTGDVSVSAGATVTVNTTLNPTTATATTPAEATATPLAALGGTAITAAILLLRRR